MGLRAEFEADNGQYSSAFGAVDSGKKSRRLEGDSLGSADCPDIESTDFSLGDTGESTGSAEQAVTTEPDLSGLADAAVAATTVMENSDDTELTAAGLTADKSENRQHGQPTDPTQPNFDELIDYVTKKAINGDTLPAHISRIIETDRKVKERVVAATHVIIRSTPMDAEKREQAHKRMFNFMKAS